MKQPDQIKLLIVDDDPDLREAISLGFELTGFQVEQATDGTAAFESVKNGNFDVVLSDIRMPNGDGIHLLKSIKTLNRETPVVLLMTGFADVSPENVYALGAGALISKPFRSEEVEKRILLSTAPLTERWSQPSTVPQEKQTFILNKTIFDLEKSKQLGEFHLGKGGFSIQCEGLRPKVGTHCKFSIQFENAPFQSLEGTGIIRWAHSHSKYPTTHQCGIEILSLKESDLPTIVQSIQKIQDPAFIPGE